MRLIDLQPQFMRYETRIETWARCIVNPNRKSDSALDPDYYMRDATGARIVEDVTGPRAYHVAVDSIAEAQGIDFLCPACFAANGGADGTHRVLCWSRSRGVPDDASPGPGRWLLIGTGFHDLTLNGDGGSRSVDLSCGGKSPYCYPRNGRQIHAWHGFVTNGEVT